MTASAAGLGAAEADALLLELVATPEGRADPYPRYARLREQAPVHRSALDLWVVTRYEDCQRVLRDPRFGKDYDNAVDRWREADPELARQVAFPAEKPSLLFLNPPDHTRLRGLVTRAFTPKTVEGLRPRIVALVDELLDRLGEGETDLVAGLAFPLPVTVIGEMLGVPVEDRPRFQPLVRAVAALLEVFVSREALAAAEGAQRTMRSYFADLVAERRAAPRHDLVSELLAAEAEGDRLTTDELISTAVLLFAAGFETTTNLIGNGVLALLRHPDQLLRLRRDPGLLRLAVDELLRYDSPVQVDGRTALADVELGGHRLPAGAGVLTLLGSANRDPERFTEPDRLDVGRDEGASLSFGSGIHHCLGAALARVEGQVAFGRLLERFSEVELGTDEPARRDSLTLRGLVSLPVRLRRRG
ncbi:MAG: cytochrome P450 [Acidimicrobiales bacterium]